MGAVDLVVQVESPPSVASGLQRVGRAGHQVGEISQGVLFPKHRADLVHTAITVERMLDGKIERLSVPANPLDILAQQTVAATALGSIDVEEWFATVRRSAPFASLPRSAFEATLDLLAGRYPSDEFAELRPRIIWDRNAGTIEGRPGAQRLAVTSGGTIPDRGLFGVYIIGTEAEGTGVPGAERVRTAGSARPPRQGRAPGGRARRGDGLRIPGGRRLCPGRHQLEDRGHHARPRAGLPRVRPARQAALLEGRLPGPARGPGPGPRRVRPRTVSVRRRAAPPNAARPAAWTTSPPTTCSSTWPSRSSPPRWSPATRPSWWNASTMNSATGGWSCTARSACRSMRRGPWPWASGCTSATGWTAPPWPPTTASCCGCP